MLLYYNFVILCFYMFLPLYFIFYLQKEIKIKASDESFINQIVEGKLHISIE